MLRVSVPPYVIDNPKSNKVYPLPPGVDVKDVIVTNNVHSPDHSEADLSYAAGFFDGEGCVQIYSRNRGRGQIEYINKVSIGNTDFEVLEWFQAKFGGRVGNQRAGVNKPIKYWTATNKVAHEFLMAVEPYLKVKRDQAQIVMDACDRLRNLPRVGFGRSSNADVYAEWERSKEALLAAR